MSLILSPSASSLFLLPTLSLPDTGLSIDLNASPDKNAAKLLFSLQLRETLREPAKLWSQPQPKQAVG